MTAEIDFWMNPASVDTGSVDRDNHLKSADFFDVENHKEISFTSTSFKQVDDVNYLLKGIRTKEKYLNL